MKQLFTSVLTAVLLLGGLSAQAAYDNVTLTNSLTVISNSTSVVQSQAFVLHAGAALAVAPRFNGAGTTNLVVGLDLYDGQNWTTTAPLQYTNACAGFGTNVVGGAVIPASSLSGFSQVRWDYTSTTDFTNIVVTGVDLQQLY